MEGHRYCLLLNNKNVADSKEVQDLLPAILNLLHSIITTYQCDGCFYCCMYYECNDHSNWLCQFDFSKVLSNDIDIYNRFYSQPKIMKEEKIIITKESYQMCNEWPLIESEPIWTFSPKYLKDLFSNTLFVNK